MEEKSSVNSQDSSTVLIVGAGPTGLTAAVELARLQIPVRIIEKNAAPSKTSRAVGVQARTLELFEQRGLVESMLQKGNKGVATAVYSEGKRIFRLEFSHNGSDYPCILIIPQSETEAILHNELEKLGVTVEREVELIALSQSPNHGDFVKAILKHHRRNGLLEEFNCAYLISSEGAHSICRTTLDQQFKGNTRNEVYVLGDLSVSGDLAETDLHIFYSELGIMALFALGGGRFRLIANNPLSPPLKGGSPSLEELETIYDQRSHIPVKLHDLSWGSWFRINSRMVDNLRVGRVFVGGDSAHIHSPAGGQGMNTGIQDMINLAWKLAFVLKGQADQKLLDTYTDDRIPVIRDVLKNTEGFTEALNSKSSLFRKAFSVFAPWILGAQFVQANGTARVSQLSLNYRSSPLSVSHGKAAAAREVKAGDRVPNLRVVVLVTGGGDSESATHHEPKSGESSLFHVLNPNRFTLLFANLTDAEATLHSVESSLAAWKALLETYNVASAPGQEQRFRSVFGSQSSLLLVRPDGYVAFAGTEHSSAALADYLSNWFPAQKQDKVESERASQ